MNSVPNMKPVDALNRLIEIATSYAVSQTFFTACNLGLFEQLSHGAMTAARSEHETKYSPARLRTVAGGPAASRPRGTRRRAISQQ